jgi:hypothetical protein
MMEERTHGLEETSSNKSSSSVRRLRGYRHQRNLEGCHLEWNPVALTHGEFDELKDTSKTRV